MPTITWTIDAVVEGDTSGAFPNPFPERPPSGTFAHTSVLFTSMVGEFPTAPAQIIGHHVRFSTGDAVPAFLGADKFLFGTPLWELDPSMGPLIIFLVIAEGSSPGGPWASDLWAAIYDPDTGISTLEYAVGGFWNGGELVDPADFPALVAATLYAYHQPPTHWHGEFQLSWQYPDEEDPGGMIVDAMDMAAVVI